MLFSIFVYDSQVKINFKLTCVYNYRLLKIKENSKHGLSFEKVLEIECFDFGSFQVRPNCTILLQNKGEYFFFTKEI